MQCVIGCNFSAVDSLCGVQGYTECMVNINCECRDGVLESLCSLCLLFRGVCLLSVVSLELEISVNLKLEHHLLVAVVSMAPKLSHCDHSSNPVLGQYQQTSEYEPDPIHDE